VNGGEAKLYTTEQVVHYNRQCVGNQTSSLACSTMYPSSSNKLPILYCALSLTKKKKTNKRMAHRSGPQHSLQTRHLSYFLPVFVHSRFTAPFTSQKPNYFTQMNVCLYKVKAKKSDPYTGPERPLGLQVAETPRVSIQSAHEGGNVVSHTHRPPLLPMRYRNTTGTHSLVAECGRND
jgi:hypothetical protein